MLQWVGLCMTDRWEQWGRQRWEGMLEDRAQGGLGHPHTWPDAAAGVWRLLLHERYQIYSTCKHVAHHRVWLWRKELFYYPVFSCTLSQMTRTSRMHFTLTLYSLLLTLSAGELELRRVIVCVCVCVRGVTWPEHRALRFHEIVCIREVRKTESYFLKSCDPVLATSLWRGQTASHRGVNHSLMLLAAADTSTLLFLALWALPSSLIFSECEDIYPHHSRSLCSDVQEVQAPGSDGWGDLWFFYLRHISM